MEVYFTKNVIERRRNVNFIDQEKSIHIVIKIDNEIYVGFIDIESDVSLISDQFIDRFKI